MASGECIVIIPVISSFFLLFFFTLFLLILVIFLHFCFFFLFINFQHHFYIISSHFFLFLCVLFVFKFRSFLLSWSIHFFLFLPFIPLFNISYVFSFLVLVPPHCYLISFLFFFNYLNFPTLGILKVFSFVHSLHTDSPYFPIFHCVLIPIRLELQHRATYVFSMILKLRCAEMGFGLFCVYAFFVNIPPPPQPHCITIIIFFTVD